MVLAVEAGHPDVDDRPAVVPPPLAIASSMPFCTAGMNCRGMAPPDDLVDELEAVPALERLDAHEGHPELPVAAGLLLVLALRLRLPGDRLPVGDHHRLGLHLDPELASQPLGDDGEVGLAHAAEQGLVGLVVALARRGRDPPPAGGAGRS